MSFEASTLFLRTQNDASDASKNLYFLIAKDSTETDSQTHRLDHCEGFSGKQEEEELMSV